MKGNRPYVIGLSSPSGGGKTTITKALSKKLPNNTAVYFDEFDDSTVHPADLAEWAANGGDYNVWKAPGLVAELKGILKKNEFQYLIFDAPLGRANSELGEFIDFMVFIDTPLDVAMARRFLRDCFDVFDNNKEADWNGLKKELVGYLNGGRSAYLEMLKSVKPSSDFVVDGILPIDAVCQSIVLKINENQSLLGNA